MRGLRFIARAASVMPHPEKASRGGEDGFFLTRDGRVLGVADGVGGWADQGVNPAFFTWLFMKRCLHYTTADGPRPMLKDVLQNAWADTVKAGLQGSCTTAVVAFDSAPGNSSTEPLTVMLVGDCGVIVVRDEQVVMRTKERQYKFNFPHQIGSDGSSSPNKLAATETVQVQKNDVVILGTDGVFDNVFDNELVELIKKANTDAKTSGRPVIDCQKLADAVARLATKHGADTRYVSPFSVAAVKAGYRYVGGKMDDVCVVAGVVGDAEAGEAGKPVGLAPAYDDVEGYFKWAKKPCAAMPPLRSGGKL
jgi:protein phosphatase PTC7